MSDQSYGKSAKKLPSSEEIEAMVAFPHDTGNEAACEVLCQELRSKFEELETTPLEKRPPVIVIIKAINAQMRSLHCPICLPE
jgi:hypothetical protein